ncbi:riboflavin biosynthesis protein RibF [Methylovorus sp. MM2]|uniref:bifunctional riboflavin kinase/FAD synthetase n=1 Tax=Methylovorus sp. MM2 TaxID=1848038 RepID=UPI0007DEA2AC|nr:bifunctional riboflavin kinase/FAD synthetase [Methylovorus sp. MM2]OAM52389.1 riboflavin biosynthesis protein RibF [Methylovorus sp. MM2]
MQVFRHIPSVKVDSPSPALVLAIGNFDGMHLGHQALLKRLVEVADATGLTAAVMTFEPHPREFFTPDNAPARLTSLREKLEFFEDAGVAQVYICRFNRQFSGLSADVFIQDILRTALNAQSILVGNDFRFGAKRHGSVADLREAGFDLVDFPEVRLESVRVSSTAVRDALAAGELELARALLGRPYSISGKVVHGAKRGRQLGFPTANVHMRHERPALTGVYAVKLDGLAGVANLGVRPTVAGIPKLMLEVHLFDFDGDLYDRHVHVQFLKKIREEMKFPNFDALKQQIAFDSIAARTYFSNI